MEITEPGRKGYLLTKMLQHGLALLGLDAATETKIKAAIDKKEKE